MGKPYMYEHMYVYIHLLFKVTLEILIVCYVMVVSHAMSIACKQTRNIMCLLLFRIHLSVYSMISDGNDC